MSRIQFLASLVAPPFAAVFGSTSRVAKPSPPDAEYIVFERDGWIVGELRIPNGTMHYCTREERDRLVDAPPTAPLGDSPESRREFTEWHRTHYLGIS